MADESQRPSDHAYAVWWLTQFRRWGMVAGTPDYAGIAKQVMRTDLYESAMKEIGYKHGGLVLVAKGYAIALLIDTPLGFLLGLSTLFRRSIDPIIQILRPVSPLAWLPLGLVPSRTRSRPRSSRWRSARRGRRCSTPRWA